MYAPMVWNVCIGLLNVYWFTLVLIVFILCSLMLSADPTRSSVWMVSNPPQSSSYLLSSLPLLSKAPRMLPDSPRDPREKLPWGTHPLLRCSQILLQALPGSSQALIAPPRFSQRLSHTLPDSPRSAREAL